MFNGITVAVKCDGCGLMHQFETTDGGWVVPTGWALFEVAMDVTRWKGSGHVYADGRWYCDACDNAAAGHPGGEYPDDENGPAAVLPGLKPEEPPATLDPPEPVATALSNLRNDLLIAELRDRHIPWSRRTFGDGMRTKGICRHIEKELDEIRANPYAVEEWIDVAILALDGAWRCGVPAASVVVVLFEKMAKIRTRTYPAPVSDDEPSEHVRDLETTRELAAAAGRHAEALRGLLREANEALDASRYTADDANRLNTALWEIIEMLESRAVLYENPGGTPKRAGIAIGGTFIGKGTDR